MIENFAPNLIRLRKQKELSQKELAKKLGISPQTISNIENQTAYPTFANLEKIAKFFKATPNQLFGTSSQIELENSVFETDDYVDKANLLLKAVNTFHNFSLDLEDYSTPEAYALETITKLDNLLKREPILDPETDEHLYRYIPTGILVRAEDKTEPETEYELAYRSSILEKAFDRIEEIEDLYQKAQYIVNTQDLLDKKS